MAARLPRPVMQSAPVHFAGVDLAWGQKRPTGLAVLDGSGRLLHVSAVRTDEEIVGILSPFVEGDCLVTFDALLIVRNATGNRPTEAALNRDFGRFETGQIEGGHRYEAGANGYLLLQPPAVNRFDEDERARPQAAGTGGIAAPENGACPQPAGHQRRQLSTDIAILYQHGGPVV